MKFVQQAGLRSAFAKASGVSHDHSSHGHTSARPPPQAKRRVSMGAEKASPEPSEAYREEV